MQLKPYQQQVISDLDRFLGLLEGRSTRQAYDQFWREHPRSPLVPQRGEAVEPYKENVPGVPHLCLKVPTGGGKTYLACAALSPVFRTYPMLKAQAVVWLVPSLPILEQTLKNLRDKNHPYRMRLDAEFGSRVEVYDKQRLLGGLHATTAREQLTVVVMSFDSLRAKNKDDRKMNQENSANIGFETELLTAPSLLLTLPEGIDPTSSMAALRHLNPVVIVDESHNAETELSVEMLQNLNPSFILDLTATPRKNANLLCFVDAWELKKEHMVKLPVIVYNHFKTDEVLENAVFLQKKLENEAEQEQKRTGKFIRPIVLFQAQPKSSDEAETFEKIKKQLVEAGIPEERIKIKTAQINELKGVDLLAADCPVRYIITVNALKEGWDCPFAYILATLANKSSAVDVEQILGRILRQPYATKTASPMLNSSFVLTSSARFRETLDNIVRGLNRAGFSENDYKITAENAPAAAPAQPEMGNLFSQVAEPAASGWGLPTEIGLQGDLPDFSKIATEGIAAAPPTVQTGLARMEELARTEQARIETAIEETNQTRSAHIPDALTAQVKKYMLRDVFRAPAQALRLPQFFLKFKLDPFATDDDSDLLFDKKMLLGDFQLSKCNASIDFDAAPVDAWKIDLDEADHLPKFTRLDAPARAFLIKYLLDPSKKDKRGEVAATRMISVLGKLDHISDTELRKYLLRVVDDWDDDRYQDFAQNEWRYKSVLRNRIAQLADEFGRKKFGEWLDTGKIFCKPVWQLPDSIEPGDVASSGLSKTIYEREGKMNDMEQRIISALLHEENVLCWTRNLDRGKGFLLNGFLNHYPDFIVLTKSGKTILLETKGDDRDNSDSEDKLHLGKTWESHARRLGDFRYFMVFENNPIKDALLVEELVKRVREM